MLAYQPIEEEEGLLIRLDDSVPCETDEDLYRHTAEQIRAALTYLASHAGKAPAQAPEGKYNIHGEIYVNSEIRDLLWEGGYVLNTMDGETRLPILSCAGGNYACITSDGAGLLFEFYIRHDVYDNGMFVDAPKLSQN